MEQQQREKLEKDSRIESFNERFVEYIKEQHFSDLREAKERENKGPEIKITDDLAESRQNVDMGAMDEHDRLVQKHHQERSAFAEWLREERAQMRRDDRGPEYSGPTPTRGNHHFQDREVVRDEASEMLRYRYQSFQQDREQRRWDDLAEREERSVAALDERHGTDDLSHLHNRGKEADQNRTARAFEDWLSEMRSADKEERTQDVRSEVRPERDTQADVDRSESMQRSEARDRSESITRSEIMIERDEPDIER